MGHITRDVAIATEIHRQLPEADLSWLASPLATGVLQEAGERLLPESALSADYDRVGHKVIDGFGLNIAKYAFFGRKPWAQNVELFKRVTYKYHFDLIIGDEIYELMYALIEKRMEVATRLIMIHDFIGAVAMSKNPLERAYIYHLNRKFARGIVRIPVTHFFVGEPDDVPEWKPVSLLQDLRGWAQKNCHFLGYIIRFDPDEYTDKTAIRAKLGYSNEPLVICSLGGASVGKELLELCGKTYPILREEIGGLRMMMVCGALLPADSIRLAEGIEVRGYVPNLYEHFAASDLAIVVGGGTSTVELTALRRPFIYFPLERQFDQQIYISQRLARHRAGIRMSLCETTPESLAEMVLSNIGKKVDYTSIPVDGAQKAVELIRGLG